jgi:hypothetical protein
MADFIEEFIFYGDDLKIERFPKETQLIFANPPMQPVKDVELAVTEALDNPLKAESLEKQLNPSSRVTIAFDDPCLPIPLMRSDIRGRVIEVLLKRLFALGIGKEHIRLICANGLHRKWTLDELSLILGKKVIKEMGPERISCHDATDDKELVFLGSTGSGHEVEINRAVTESDITIYVNINCTSMNGGWKSILVGLGSWRSIRRHHTPRQWNLKTSIMNPETNPMHKILREMGALVRQKCNIFQVESVVNNSTWPPHLDKILCPINHPDRSGSPGIPTRTMLTLASAAPRKVKRLIRNALRSNYQLCSISAGDIDEVHRHTLERLCKQQNVRVENSVDVLIFGVPNLSPYSSRSIFNPILLRGLVLGYLLGTFYRRPLLKKGGILVAYNPGIEKFHPLHHPSYIDFWKKDIEIFYNPEECWNELSESYAQNPEYIRKYRDHYAYHGAHCLINWMWSGMGMKHPGAVILAGAKEPDTARKLGFTAARDLNTAAAMAREWAGSNAAIAYQVMPPVFCVDIDGDAADDQA